MSRGVYLSLLNSFLSSLLSHSECKIVDNVLLWVLFPIARVDTFERCRDEIDPTKMKYEVTPILRYTLNYLSYDISHFVQGHLSLHFISLHRIMYPLYM